MKSIKELLDLKDDQTSIRDRWAVVLRRNPLTINEMAAEIGINKTTIRDALSGKRKLDTKRLVRVLDWLEGQEEKLGIINTKRCTDE